MTEEHTTAELAGEATHPEPRPFLPIGLAALVLGPVAIGLLVVGVLIAALWYGKRTARERHHVSASRASLQHLCVALKAYETDFGRYPPSPNAALVAAMWPANRQGARSLEIAPLQLSPSGELLDSWGRPCVYEFREGTDRTFRLYSIGPNGVDENGQGDDISVGR